jgi:tetratricopeptide (TPR) repeat protein
MAQRIKNQRENREIRVFLSSTFRDMQFERDYLIKKIFPEIRQACRERLVEFTEIDLRWGVTEEEAKQGKVVQLCLEEIDNCRPYFLGFMGERFGWVPKQKDLHHFDELKTLFPLVEPSLKANKSVTEMEILHGVLENPKMTDHAFFYLRDKTLTDELAEKSGTPSDYYDNANKIPDAKLIDLKSRVRSSGFPFHENYCDLEALGIQVKDDLLAVLNKRYPQDKTPTPLEAERLLHEAYAIDRSLAYLPSARDTGAMDAYIQSRKQDASTPPLVIGGESGLGKSALLSYWLYNNQQAHPTQFLIQHYTGVSGDATPTSVLRRIMLEIKDRNKEQDEVPTKAEYIVKDFPLWLAKIHEDDPLLLAIDAINQIEGNNLNWLPSFIAPNVTLIVSALPGTHFDQLKQRNWQIHTVEPLDNARRKTLINNYLQKSYSKSLSDAQINTIAEAPQSANPLFLITLLEELRVFGVFEKLDALIAGYLQAPDPAALFAKVLQRMEADYRDKDNRSTLIPVVKAIWAARKGLTETELLGITGLNRQDLSIILLGMDYHLSNKGGLRNFFHDYLRQAVGARYLETEGLQKKEHRSLADYFDQLPLDARKVTELPWQWQQANEENMLKECLIDIPMFEKLYDIEPYELLGYWLALKGKYDIGATYRDSFEKWVMEGSPSDEYIALIASKLGSFLLVQCAIYDSAEPLYRRALDINEKVLGSEHSEVATGLNNLALLLAKKGDHAGAETLYRRALEIREKVFGTAHPDVANSLTNLAVLLTNIGDYAGAEPLYRRALEIYETVLGPAHPNVAAILNNLAALLVDKGDYASAEPMYRRALEINEKVLGPEHPDVASFLNNLALLLYNKGDTDGAEPLYLRALEISEKVLGSEHPHVATSLNNLAVLLVSKGDFASAEPLYLRALGIREKMHGPEHPDVAQSIHNLAELLANKGDYASAEPLYRHALEINENVLGPVHPDVATILFSLAGLLESKGDYEDAETLHRRALVIYETVLGSEHPDVAASLNKLAVLLDNKGDYAGAELLYRRVLETQVKVLGPTHPDVVSCLYNLAGLLESKGDYVGAESLYRRALEIEEKVLGSVHPDVAASLNELAVLLYNKGNYAGAEPLYRRALAIREAVLGSEHPDVATSLNNLAVLLDSKSNYAGAEHLYRRALEISEKVLGSEHPDVVDSLNSLAWLLVSKGDSAGAAPLYRRALMLREKALGPDHPDVANSLNNLAGLLNSKGDSVGAEPLYRRALAIREKVLGSEHPDVAYILNKLAVLLNDKGDATDAEPLYRRALAIREKVLDAEHPDVALSLNNLANFLSDKGDNTGAEPLYRRVLEIRERTLGADHQDTIETQRRIARCLREQGKLEEALALFESVIEKLSRVNGETSKETLFAQSGLAASYKRAGNISRAKEILIGVLEKAKTNLGTEHEMTKIFQEELLSL